jgi:hypothetical protein
MFGSSGCALDFDYTVKQDSRSSELQYGHQNQLEMSGLNGSSEECCIERKVGSSLPQN